LLAGRRFTRSGIDQAAAVESRDDIMVKGALLCRIPHNKDDEVFTETAISPSAERFLSLSTYPHT